MSNPVYRALDELFEKSLKKTDLGYFEQQHDPDWPSQCEFGGPDDKGQVLWKPVPRQQPPDFSGLERALELSLHSDIKAYYGSFYSGSLHTISEEGPVALIQIWNDRDFDHLLENLIGHYLAKQRLDHCFTAFIATTEEDSELFLSIDNDSGKILLEEPGQAPLREVESGITRFIERLTPFRVTV